MNGDPPPTAVELELLQSVGDGIRAGSFGYTASGDAEATEEQVGFAYSLGFNIGAHVLAGTAPEPWVDSQLAAAWDYGGPHFPPWGLGPEGGEVPAEEEETGNWAAAAAFFQIAG